MVQLSEPGQIGFSHAKGVSSDGAVVVGFSGREAFRWTAATGVDGLGDLPGGDSQSVAESVSGDGSIVVGNGRSSAGTEAFYWTASTRMIVLRDKLIAAGATNLQGWILSNATAISADGSTIVGVGINPGGHREA